MFRGVAGAPTRVLTINWRQWDLLQTIELNLAPIIVAQPPPTTWGVRNHLLGGYAEGHFC